MSPILHASLAALAFAGPLLAFGSAALAQQDILRGSRGILDNAQQPERRSEQVERQRQQQQQQQQLFELDVQRRQIQNDQLRNAPQGYGVPPGATYAPTYQQPTYQQPGYVQPGYQPGYAAPQQPACRAFAPAYDQAGRFLGNVCVQ